MKITSGVLLILTLGAAPAWAVLGEYESSVVLDQKYMRGEDRVTLGQGYKLHQITSSNGAVMTEYVSPEGKVFGVSWRAPFIPTWNNCWDLTSRRSGRPRRRRRVGVAAPLSCGPAILFL